MIKPNEITLYLLIYIAVLVPLFVLSSIGQQQLFLSFFLIFMIFIFALKREIVLWLYIVFLPTNGIIEKKYYLFELIGINQLLGFLVIIMILWNKNILSIKEQKWTSISILVIIVYWIIYFSKNALLGIGYTYNFNLAIPKIINQLLLLIPIFMLSRRKLSSEQIALMNIGVFYGIVNMLLFTFLSGELPTLGIKSLGSELSELATDRLIGVIADGDSNTLGAFFAMSAAFLIVSIKRYNKNIVMTLILLSVYSIALTGSRTAIISFGFVLIVYYLFSSYSQVKLTLAVLMIIGILLTSDVWYGIIDRLMLSNEQLYTDTSGNRIGKWILYLSFINSNTTNWIWGVTEELLIGWGNTFYAAHNFYIQMTYNIGLFFPVVFFATLYGIYRELRKLNLALAFVMISIPFLAITFFVSDFGIFYYYFIILIVLQQDIFAAKGM